MEIINRKNAIEILKLYIRKEEPIIQEIKSYVEAYNHGLEMAISVLSIMPFENYFPKNDDGWISVIDALPLNEEVVLVSCYDDLGDTPCCYTSCGWYFDGNWIVDNERNYHVAYWMPFPEPYKEK